MYVATVITVLNYILHADRQKAAEIFFEKFGVPGLHFQVY